LDVGLANRRPGIGSVMFRSWCWLVITVASSWL
jgi:hypothetical protein